MWRRLPAFGGILILFIAIASLGWGALTMEVGWLIFGGIMLYSSIQYFDLLYTMRMASDWPPGIIWPLAYEAGRESQRKRHAKRRRNLHLVRRRDIGQDSM